MCHRRSCYTVWIVNVSNRRRERAQVSMLLASFPIKLSAIAHLLVPFFFYLFCLFLFLLNLYYINILKLNHLFTDKSVHFRITKCTNTESSRNHGLVFCLSRFRWALSLYIYIHIGLLIFFVLFLLLHYSNGSFSIYLIVIMKSATHLRDTRHSEFTDFRVN